MTVNIGCILTLSQQRALFHEADFQRLCRLGNVRWHDSDSHLSAAQAARFLAGCDIALGSWGTAFPCQELLEACPQLGLWEHVAGTVKHMFGPHLDGRRLVIASCAPAIAEGVAEMALGQIIVGLRRVLQNAAQNRTGPSPKPERVVLLPHAVIGVIGASQVGRRLIALLKPFGPRILLYDPYVAPEQAGELGVELSRDLTALCRQCDALTLHVPALDSTRRMLGRAQLQAMRPDAVLVNTSRGSCIDEQALIEELAQGRLFAFLDVSDPEPAAADSPLRRLPNVVYTSHIAGGASWHLGKQAVDDVEKYLAGGQPLMAVTADQLERLA